MIHLVTSNKKGERVSKKTLEQQLIDKCEELKITLDINDDSVWIRLTTHHEFGTNGASWEHSIIRDETEWWFDEQAWETNKRYNYKTEYNATIRMMLEAIDTITELPQDELCDNEDCTECYEDIEQE